MTIIHAGDVSYGFQVHKRVAGIFTAFINELVDRGYTLKTSQSGTTGDTTAGTSTVT